MRGNKKLFSALIIFFFTLHISRTNHADNYTKHYKSSRLLSFEKIIAEVTEQRIPQSSSIDYPLMNQFALKDVFDTLSASLENKEDVLDYFEQFIVLKIAANINMFSIIDSIAEVNLYRKNQIEDYTRLINKETLNFFPKLNKRVEELNDFLKDIRSDFDYKDNFILAQKVLQKRIVDNVVVINKLENKLEKLHIDSFNRFIPNQQDLERIYRETDLLKNEISYIYDSLPILKTPPLKNFISKNKNLFDNYKKFCPKLYDATQKSIEKITSNLLFQLKKFDVVTDPIKYVRDKNVRKDFALNENISTYILNEFPFHDGYAQIKNHYNKMASYEVIRNLSLGVSITITTAGMGGIINLVTRAGIASLIGLTSRGFGLAYRGATVLIDGAITTYYAKNIVQNYKNLDRLAFTSIEGPSILTISEQQYLKNKIKLDAILFCLFAGISTMQARNFSKEIRFVSNREIFISGSPSEKIAGFFYQKGYRFKNISSTHFKQLKSGAYVGFKSSGVGLKNQPKLLIKTGPWLNKKTTHFGNFRQRFFEANGTYGKIGYYSGRLSGGTSSWLLLKFHAIPNAISNFPAYLARTLGLAVTLGVIQGLISSYMGIWQVILNQEMELKSAQQQRALYLNQKKLIEEKPFLQKDYFDELEKKELRGEILTLEHLRSEWFKLYLSTRSVFPYTHRAGRGTYINIVDTSLAFTNALAVNENQILLSKLILNEELSEDEVRSIKDTRDAALFTNLNILINWYSYLKQFPEYKEKIERYMFQMGYYFYKDKYSSWLDDRLNEVDCILEGSISALDDHIMSLQNDVESAKDNQLIDILKEFPQSSIIFRFFQSRKEKTKENFSDWLEINSFKQE